MFALACEFVGHMPVHFLVFGGAVEDFAAEAATLIGLFLADSALLHGFRYRFIITLTLTYFYLVDNYRALLIRPVCYCYSILNSLHSNT